MSKKALSVVALILIVLGAAYVGSPYWAARQFRDAALSADVDKLDATVDFPAVRESLKSQLNVAIAAKMDGDSSIKNNPFAGLSMMLIPTIVDKMVDAIVTPEGPSALVKRGEVNRPEGQPLEINSNVDFNYEYIGIDRFRVSLHKHDDQKDDTIKLVFERRGLFSWKMIRIQIPDSTFHDKPADSVAPTEQPTTDTESPVTSNVTAPDASATPYVQPPLGADNSSFSDYPANPLSGQFMMPILSGDPDHSTYRTRLTDAAKGGVNFAGHFALTQIGCGTQCNFAMIVDGNTGKVIDFPIGGEEYLEMSLTYHADSSLVKAYWNPDEGDQPTCEHADFVQEGTSFRRLPNDGKRALCPS